MRLPSGAIARLVPPLFAKGAFTGGVITNFVRVRGAGRVKLQIATAAIRVITRAMLHGIATLQRGGWTVLVIPIGDSVVGSFRAFLI